PRRLRIAEERQRNQRIARNRLPGSRRRDRVRVPTENRLTDFEFAWRFHSHMRIRGTNPRKKLECLLGLRLKAHFEGLWRLGLLRGEGWGRDLGPLSFALRREDDLVAEQARHHACETSQQSIQDSKRQALSRSPEGQFDWNHRQPLFQNRIAVLL